VSEEKDDFVEVREEPVANIDEEGGCWTQS